MNTTQATQTGIAYGKKYDQNLDIVEIAKRVRAAIKAAIKTGELPVAKYSVRIDRFAGGRSLDVRATCVPFRILNAARVLADHTAPNVHSGIPWMSDEARALQTKLEAMIGAYNFDGSDVQSDYFHVNFYGHVDIDGTLTRDEEREAIIDEHHEAINAQERAEVMADMAAEAVANDTSDGTDAFAFFLDRCNA